MRALSGTVNVAGRSGRTEINDVALEGSHVGPTAELVFPHFRSCRICMTSHFLLRALLSCASLPACPHWEWRQMKPLSLHAEGFSWKSLLLIWVSAGRISSPLRNFISYFPSFLFFKMYLLIKHDTQRAWSLSLERRRENANSPSDTQIWKIVMLFQGS